MESSGGMKLTSEDVTMSSFLQMAKEYRLKGPAYDLCEHNSGVAASANRPQVVNASPVALRFSVN